MHAIGLAQRHSWWGLIAGRGGLLLGLWTLYRHSGITADWFRLVDELTPHFVDPTTGGPLPGLETEWSDFTGYRAEGALLIRDWEAAEHLMNTQVEFLEKQTAATLALLGAERPLGRPRRRFITFRAKSSRAATEDLSESQDKQIEQLAMTMNRLGRLHLARGQAECVECFQRAIRLFQLIGSHDGERTATFYLGHAYKDVPSVRSLDQAESYYHTTLELTAESDTTVQAKCLHQLALVAVNRAKESRKHEAWSSMADHLNSAAELCQQSIEFTPLDATNDLAVLHNTLGDIYREMGILDDAKIQFEKAVRYYERLGDRYWAGMTRYNIGATLFQAGKLDEAELWTEASLRELETARAVSAEIDPVRQLVGRVRRAISVRKDGLT
jgi:tetratricopeptide (TPR) repeat protein